MEASCVRVIRVRERGGAVRPVTQAGADLPVALEAFLDHPVFVAGEDALDIRDQFLILIVQIVYARGCYNEGIRLLENFLHRARSSLSLRLSRS